MILADAREISVDAAIPALLSPLDGDVALKDKQVKAPKDLLGGQHVFTLLLLALARNESNFTLLWLTTGCSRVANAAPHTNKKPRGAAAWLHSKRNLIGLL